MYLSFIKYFHFEMIKNLKSKCKTIKRNSKLNLKMQ